MGLSSQLCPIRWCHPPSRRWAKLAHVRWIHVAELTRDLALARLDFSVLPELADSQRAWDTVEKPGGQRSVSDGTLPWSAAATARATCRGVSGERAVGTSFGTWSGDLAGFNFPSVWVHLLELFKRILTQRRGFPGGSDGEASACNGGDLGLIPGLRRSPGGGHGNPLQ